MSNVSKIIPTKRIKYTFSIFLIYGLEKIKISFVVFGIFLFLKTLIELFSPITPALHIHGIIIKLGKKVQKTIANKPPDPKLNDSAPTVNPMQNPLNVNIMEVARMPTVTKENMVIIAKIAVFCKKEFIIMLI